MSEQSENSNKESAEKKQEKKKDPRHIITPDAFAVDKELLGLPLATPKVRGFAMIFDLILIQQLSQVDSFVLGLAIAMVLYLLSSRKSKKTVGSLRNNIFKALAILLFSYIILLEGWAYIQQQSVKPASVSQTSAESSETIVEQQQQVTQAEIPLNEQLSQAKLELSELKDENRALKADENSDLMDIIEAVGKKFGYGFGWAGIYFTLFCYLLNGQTPGKFIFRIRIIQLDGKKLSIWNSFGRYGGYAASVVTGLSGFFQIYWDANRQGLHDKVSGTVVIKL